MRVTVIGGGIMGLSTAFALCQEGHRVTVFEQGSIPNPLGSSVDDHRLIRHPYGPMHGYSRLIDPALSAWDRIWAETGQRHLHHTGTLILARDDLHWAKTSLSDIQDMGIEHKIIDLQKLRDHAPLLKPDGVEFAVWVQSGGALLAEPIIRSLARYLILRGVTINTHTPIIDIDTKRASVTLEDGLRVSADRLVVAAGPWVRDLCPAAIGRVKPSRQLVLYLKPPPRLLETWRKAPMVLDIHGSGGIYVVPPVGSTGLKVGDHSFSLKGHPDKDRTAKSAEISQLLDACRGRIEGIDDYEVSDAKVCFYTVQAKERFILESVDKALLMTGFSGHGFKFGALMGALAAGMLTHSTEPGEISDLAAGRIDDPSEISRITSLCLG